MTITLTKGHIALAVLAVTLLIPATAVATHIFDDVPDGAFYADAVEWAADNGITLGRTPTMFDPDAGVTRGESVTFLDRYDTNIVQPALGRAEAAFDPDGVNDWNGSAPLTQSLTIEAPAEGALLVRAITSLGIDANHTSGGTTRINNMLQVDGVDALASAPLVGLDFSANNHDEQLVAEALVPVTAGSHTVTSQLNGATATALVYVYSRGITVEFIPYDGTGATFAPSAISPADSADQNVAGG